jgi:hypothetical protein
MDLDFLEAVLAYLMCSMSVQAMHALTIALVLPIAEELARCSGNRRRQLLDEGRALMVAATIVSPWFKSLPLGYRSARRFTRARSHNGFWKNQVMNNWVALGRRFPDVEQDRYLTNFRMTKETFWWLYRTMGHHLERKGPTGNLQVSAAFTSAHHPGTAGAQSSLGVCTVVPSCCLGGASHAQPSSPTPAQPLPKFRT